MTSRLSCHPARAQEVPAGFEPFLRPGTEGALTIAIDLPGHPAELRGREAIRAFFADRGRARDLLVMDGVEAVIRETDDPAVVVTEISHHGWSKAANAPYRHLALGVIRVRDGQIVRYDDYMDPIALARLLGRTAELAATLNAGP